MNRYAQSIVKLAMIISLFATFLADLISYVVIFNGIFHKFTRDFENFTVLLTNLTWLLLVWEFNVVIFTRHLVVFAKILLNLTTNVVFPIC